MRRRNWIWLGVVLIWLPTITQKVRAEPYSITARNWCQPGTRCDRETWKCWGSDDYCPKQQPFTPCFTSKTCVDDYCKKSLPCEPLPNYKTCYDGYCKKRCPVRLW